MNGIDMLFLFWPRIEYWHLYCFT